MSDKVIKSSHPIEAHGVIGDQGTTALVADDGTLAFLCWPHFDSPTVFAALLDGDNGGAWLHPRAARGRRGGRYRPNVLRISLATVCRFSSSTKCPASSHTSLASGTSRR